MEDIIETLKDRSFIEDITDEAIRKHLQTPQVIYVGFDPTADSLHVGNLVGILALKHLQNAGHRPVVVFGGATALIGDPSGKTKERPLLSKEQVKTNISHIEQIFKKILDFSNPQTTPLFLNNHDWLGAFSFIDFLRDVGKNFRLGPMLSKEMVKTRLESEEGLSFTEFSYQILQGYDFYHLANEHNVTIQFGGSDQWGNIVSGIELVRKKLKKSVYGATWPLLTKSDGTKFGKTESGAVWLSENKCSCFEFYQFFIRAVDADVISLMRALTFMDIQEINHYASNLEATPMKAQEKLAFEVTKIVHGEEKAELARQASIQAKPGAKMDLTVENLKNLAGQIPTHSIKKEQLGAKIIDLLVDLKLAESKSFVRRLIENGGLNLNEKRILDQNYILSSKDLLETFCLIGLGKKKKILLIVE